MTRRPSPWRVGLRWLMTGVALAAAGYGAVVAATWFRYGHVPKPGEEDEDPLLDRFMPLYDIVERHRIRIAAPPAVTLAAAREMDLMGMPLVHAIFAAREWFMGATADADVHPRGLLDLVQSLGWVVLAEIPDREVVVGAVTKPWDANPTFRSIAPDRFATFAEPGYVKIAWTLRADPDGVGGSTFRTETRAVATDDDARARFRWYWSRMSPGIVLIRWLSLRPTKADAERRARATGADPLSSR